MLEIAKQKIQNMTNEELNSFILNSCLKGISKYSEEKNFSLELIEIKNTKLDKSLSEISFDYIFLISNKNVIENTSGGWEQYISYSIKNLKIKPDVLELDGKLFPIISFELEQPTAKINVNKTKMNYDINDDFLKKNWEYDKELHQQYGSSEEYIEVMNEGFKQEMEGWTALKTKLSDKCGIINGKFTLNVDKTYSIFQTPVLNKAYVGWYWNYETNEIGSVVFETVGISPIFFSTLNEDGSANWEVYSLKQ